MNSYVLFVTKAGEFLHHKSLLWSENVVRCLSTTFLKFWSFIIREWIPLFFLVSICIQVNCSDLDVVVVKRIIISSGSAILMKSPKAYGQVMTVLIVSEVDFGFIVLLT